MSGKRSIVDLDPDYEDVSEQQTKRRKVMEEDAKKATKRKIESIIKRQFDVEIENKETELMEISEKLELARSVMDRLRACIVASFYGNANQQKSTKKAPEQTPMIHPTVRKFIGKAPPGTSTSVCKTETCSSSDTQPAVLESEKIGNLCTEAKTPQLVEPQPTCTAITEKDMSGSRQGRFKVKKRIIVGNVSKSIPADQRDDNDQATHKWMVYVRGPKDNPNICGYVKKVWFFLHPSYRPNDLVEVSQAPFHLTRRGWGEFPVRVQIHFKDSRNKRVDIIHNLKLDRTYTGLQTLGAESIVDVEIERDKTEIKKEKKQKEASRTSNLPNNVEIKQEPLDPWELTQGSSQIPCETFPLSADIKLETVDHDYGRSGCVNGVDSLSSQQCVKKEVESQVDKCQTFGDVSGHNDGDISGHIDGVSSCIQTVGSSSLITTQAGSVMSSPQTRNQLTVISSSPSKQQLVSSTGSVILTSPPGNVVLRPIGPAGAATTNNTLNLKIVDSGKPATGQGVQAKVNLNLSQTGIQLNRPQTVTPARLPVNQSGNPGLVFLKCTDNQGKTFLIPQQINTTLTSPPKGNNSVNNVKQGVVNNRPILLTSTVPGTNITNVAVPGGTNLVQGKQMVQTLVRSPNTITSPNRLQKSPLSNGPVFFIKPENMNRAPLTVKTSNGVATVTSTTPNKVNSNIQIVRNCAQKQTTDLVCVKPVNQAWTSPNVGNQSVNKGQLKVTPQGLIQVQGQTTSPVVGISTSTADRTVQNSIRPKQPVVLIPSNGKVTLLPGKGKSLLNSVNSQVPTPAGNNIILLNQTVSPVGNGNVVCVTPSHMNNQNKTTSKLNKSDMFVLQTKQAKSAGGAPNHVVIIPVSSEQNSSLVTTTIANSKTPVTITTTQNKVTGNSIMSTVAGDKRGNDKTVLIVVQNDNKSTVQTHTISDTTKLTAKPPATTSLLTSLPSLHSHNTPKLSSTPQHRKVTVAAGDATQKHVLLVNDDEGRDQSQSKFEVEDRKCIMDPKKKRQKIISVKEFIQPICMKDHPDLLSLIRAAVSRHPLVSENAGRSLHPYCEATHNDWLSWNVGKRRASEWQRASCVRKFIQQALGGSTIYKGELLWTTKQILVWCRLHAYSPHYLEKPLHPTGIDLQAETSLLSDKHRKTFSSVTGIRQIQTDLASIEETNTATDTGEEEVDILCDCIGQIHEDLTSIEETNTTTDMGEEEMDILCDSPVKVRPSLQQENIQNSNFGDSECLPLTEGALYVKEMANQIGVKLQHTEVESGYLGTLVQGMLYKSMENFMSDILRETFALQVNMGRYPDTLSVGDVYEALKSLNVTDFLTNKYFGVEDNIGMSTAPT